MEINEAVWQRIDELRGKMSIRELAEATGIKEGSLQVTRINKTLPKLQMLYPIARALHTTIDYLYTGQEPTDNYDTPLFRKISSSQDLIDICNALVSTDKTDIELVKRVLNIDKL